MDSMFGVSMSKVVLDQSQVVSLVSQIEATGMPECMRMYRIQTSSLSGGFDEIVHRLSGHGLATFTDK